MSATAAGRLLFDTDKLAERDRFPAFREEVIRRYTALDIKTQDQSQFHGAIELQRAAVAVGFTDLSCFNRAFRRRCGVTPSDMRGAQGSNYSCATPRFNA
jgi:AraC-like DNA-binding protein